MALEGAWSAQSMQAMTASMNGLKQAAQSGSFAISQEGAQAYLKAIDDAQQELMKVDAKVYLLGERTKLGTSPDAQQMSAYNQESANGGAGTTGIIPAINQLKTALEDAKTAMRQAVENYSRVDADNAADYKRY
ncbi:hypothetical protein [Saccharothrix texasensis]|uniref:Excreted virulence factor EspC (Type VII ESX diderm) n=1 Tax=Saccharothrix texasensis TaxID=103734 RepID=A0A3N1HAS9_9PSEU|nr:hypothetical protein [Saccharothrix texasensis]ROP39637.1 hypothetical protein EDD40_5028 [Saccharothrix texasensis]